MECRAGRHARGAAPKLRVQFDNRAHTISFHFVPQVKNFVTAIVKLYKGVGMPANRVANRQAASAARSATSQLAQLAAAAAAAGSQAESVQRAQPPPVLSATAPAAPAGSASPAQMPIGEADYGYLAGHAEVVTELRQLVLAPLQLRHAGERWHLLCDASPRGLLPRSHDPWEHTGSVTFATWWELVVFDGLIYMLRGLKSLRELLILRNALAVLRIACNGVSTLGRPAYVPPRLLERAVRACIAFEDAMPVVAHRHSAHMVIHLVSTYSVISGICR